jgi:hypothetical protein
VRGERDTLAARGERFVLVPLQGCGVGVCAREKDCGEGACETQFSPTFIRAGYQTGLGFRVQGSGFRDQRDEWGIAHRLIEMQLGRSFGRSFARFPN